MRSGISLREDFDGERLRRLARQTKDAAQVRRLLALASIYDGGARSDAARLGNVTLQIVRDWVMRFNERGPQGLVNGRQGSRSAVAVERSAACGAGAGHRAWSDALSRRRCSLASVRPGSMALERVSRVCERADAEPGSPGHGLSQAYCSAQTSCARPSSH